MNKKDALLSERVIYIAFALWQNKISEPPAIEGFRPDDIKRVCHAFDEASAVWSRLDIGESMTLVWHGGRARTIRRRAR